MRTNQGEIDGYLLKPMNCPHHIQIYKAEPHQTPAIDPAVAYVIHSLMRGVVMCGTAAKLNQLGPLGENYSVNCQCQVIISDGNDGNVPGTISIKLNAVPTTTTTTPSRPLASSGRVPGACGGAKE